MRGDFFILRSDEQKANAVAALSIVNATPEQPYSVKIEAYSETRRQAQNSLSHMWYGEIAKQGKEYTPEQIHSRCKYRYGIPLMVNEPTFNTFWERVLSTQPTYEEIVDEIMPYTPVTRLMSMAQMAQYLTDFDREMGQKYRLTNPALYGLE